LPAFVARRQRLSPERAARLQAGRLNKSGEFHDSAASTSHSQQAAVFAVLCYFHDCASDSSRRQAVRRFGRVPGSPICLLSIIVRRSGATLRLVVLLVHCASEFGRADARRPARVDRRHGRKAAGRTKMDKQNHG